jgi:hypothetical protein
MQLLLGHAQLHVLRMPAGVLDDHGLCKWPSACPSRSSAP